jgi:hypothetical protein
VAEARLIEWAGQKWEGRGIGGVETKQGMMRSVMFPSPRMIDVLVAYFLNCHLKTLTSFYPIGVWVKTNRLIPHLRTVVFVIPEYDHPHDTQYVLNLELGPS